MARNRFRVTSVISLVLLMLCALSAIAQNRQQVGPSFLTAPSNADPLEITLDYLRTQRLAMGVLEEDINNARVLDRTESNGITHLYLYQHINGLKVHNAMINANVTHDGRLINLGNRFVSGPARAVNTFEATIDAQQAIELVAGDLGLTTSRLGITSGPNGISREMTFNSGGISKSDIPAHLVLYPTEDSIRLAWNLVVDQVNSDDWWHILVDAVDGQILLKRNWTIYDHWPAGTKARAHAKRQSAPTAPFWEQAAKLGGDGSSYFVVPFPFESPNHGNLALVSEPADPVASPFGWHDTDGVAGAEFTITRGNNVHAYPDRDGNDQPNGGEPDGGQTLTFNIVPNFEQNPVDYLEAATVNLFYWNNIVHDILAHNGFDEASGNFQETNYSGQGLGSDYVNAQSQSNADGGSTNNANFSTPSDGFNPRMRMFEWTSPASVTVNSPSSIAGVYIAGGASFGAPLDDTGIGGELELVNDGSASPSTGCNQLIGFTAGKVAVIDRGGCEFGIKVLNAENAGAIAAIVVNNQGDGLTTMGPGANGGSVTISSLFLGQSHGELIKGELQNTVNATLRQSADRRDSDYDNGVIAHEYGHGISNRLVGGPSNVSCLGGDEQQGEGWSDFFGLALTAEAHHQAGDPRGVGTYPSFEPTDGPGIRQFPYSTDMNVNPVTYDHLKTGVSIPHGVGHAWNTMLWDVYWAFVEEYGFDPDLYNGNGGNNMAIQLVNEGMKMGLCSPTFVDSRDAILAADMALFSGNNQCLIWGAFARRGLGVDADGGSAGSITDGTENFDLPSTCCLSAAITDQPESAIACSGDTVTFTVAASGTEPTYQWQRNGQDIAGQTSASLTLSNISDSDIGSYTCVVTNDCSTVTSSSAGLEILPALTATTSDMANWGNTYPDPACDDVNGNGFYDILDFITIINALP